MSYGNQLMSEGLKNRKNSNWTCFLSFSVFMAVSRPKYTTGGNTGMLNNNRRLYWRRFTACLPLTFTIVHSFALVSFAYFKWHNGNHIFLIIFFLFLFFLFQLMAFGFALPYLIRSNCKSDHVMMKTLKEWNLWSIQKKMKKKEKKLKEIQWKY